MKHTLHLLTALLLAPLSAMHAPAAEGAWRPYEVYEPVIDVIGTFGDSRVSVRLVHEDGAIYLCGQNTKQTCGPLTPEWNTVFGIPLNPKFDAFSDTRSGSNLCAV
jgi:hypothetical protein